MSDYQTKQSEEILPLFRKTDPETSAQAAEQHHASGQRQTNKAKLLAAVQRAPGRTSAEYAELADLDRHEAARRLSDLRNEGLVRQAEARKCTVKGTKAKTWQPA